MSKRGEGTETSCPEWSPLDIESYWCSLNEMFADNPALGFAIGIVGSIASWFIGFLVKFLWDSRNQLSGKWLLCINDKAGKPIKFDIYRIRQKARSVSGTIKRLHSLEDSEQKKRRYKLLGYAEGGHFVYVFWPTTQTTQSFGTCTLLRKADNHYTGEYTRPYLENESGPKGRTAKIVLTRSEGKARELISGLTDDKIRRRIWKSAFGWRKRVPSQNAKIEPTTAANLDEVAKPESVAADEPQNEN